MKIGLVIYGDLETLTGGYLYDRMLVDYLRSQGDLVQIFSLPWRNYGGRLLDNVSQPLRRSLPDARVDVLLQDELNHPSLFWLNRRLKSYTNCPIVSIVHHLRCSELRPGWQNRIYRLIESDYLARVDGFIFNSITTRDTVEALVGTSKPSVVAFPGRDGVRPDITRAEVERKAVQAGPLRVLFVGNLIPRKGLLTLLAAMARLPRGCWQLEVVGSPTTDPAYASKVLSEIERLGISDYVQLLGTLTGKALADRYASSHLLAVPSSYEGFGIVYLEGMGFSLPALASSAGAAHELITDDLDGFLVRTGDAEAITGHVWELICDRTKLVRMSLAALDRHAAHPTWGETTARIRGFLEAMVN